MPLLLLLFALSGRRLPLTLPCSALCFCYSSFSYLNGDNAFVYGCWAHNHRNRFREGFVTWSVIPLLHPVLSRHLREPHPPPIWRTSSAPPTRSFATPFHCLNLHQKGPPCPWGATDSPTRSESFFRWGQPLSNDCFLSSSASISTISANHLCLATARLTWSDVDKQDSKGWAMPIKSVLKISVVFSEVYCSSFMSYIFCWRFYWSMHRNRYYLHHHFLFQWKEMIPWPCCRVFVSISSLVCYLAEWSLQDQKMQPRVLWYFS